MEELRKTLLTNIELLQEVRDMFANLVKRQTNIMIVAIVCATAVLVATTVILTRPTHVDKQLLKYIEDERANIIQERVILQRERETISKARADYLKMGVLQNSRDSVQNLRDGTHISSK